MRFVFSEEKAAEAAAHLLHRHGGSMPHIKLLELLYLADRQSLIETGQPVTGARMVSMRHGPVLSEVLDLVAWDGTPGPWADTVSPSRDYEVSLLQPSDLQHLSDYEETVLDCVFEKFGQWDRWDLVEFTHTLPEWRDPGSSVFDIDPQVILRDAGLSDEDVREVAEQAEATWALRNLDAILR